MKNQPFFWKTIPQERRELSGESHVVVGILCNINQVIPINLDPIIHRGFFVNFLLSTGTQKGEINTSTDAFVAKMIEKGMTETQANATISHVVKSLEGFGTVEEKYESANMLANQYGYQLAPLAEQNGDPLWVEPAQESNEEPQENQESTTETS